MRENVIEDYLCRHVRAVGGKPIKFTSSNNRSLPDRICFFPNSILVLVECKAPGKKPTIKQWKKINELRALGFTVVVIDSRPKAKALVEWAVKKGKENALQEHAAS